MSIAEQIITRGWCRDTLENEDGEVCLDGAAAYDSGVKVCGRMVGASGPKDPAWLRYHDRLDALAEAIHERTGGNASVPFYNDNICTSMDEALAVAKRADEILGAGQ